MNTLAVDTVAPNYIISYASDFIIIIIIGIIEAQLCSSALIAQQSSGADPEHKNRPVLLLNGLLSQGVFR